MDVVPLRKFQPEEHRVWRDLFLKQAPLRDQQVFWKFSKGIEALGMGPDFPDLPAINFRLKKLTGFQGIPVVGLEKAYSFFEAMSERKFPIGNFIREAKDLSYTPAPDIFHDLYGHLPFLADPEIADFTFEIGRRAMKYKDDLEKLTQFERFYWFTLEFGLIETSEGRRVFGGGIASSFGECAYALSNEPTLKPFDVEAIRNQYYRIDEFQKVLYVLPDEKTLYRSIDEYERRVRDLPAPNIPPPS